MNYGGIMINYMLFILVPTMMIMSIVYYVYQRKLAVENLKKQDVYARRINVTKASFKTTLELFAMQRIIPPVHVNKVYGIINNYFVDQPITEENMRKLERLANRIAVSVAKEMNMAKSDEDTEWLKKKMLNFAILLPNNSTDYSKAFYSARLKCLLRGIGCTKSTFIQRHAA
jgi:tryptophanase